MRRTRLATVSTVLLLAMAHVQASAGTSLLDSAYTLASKRHLNFAFVKQSERILLDIVSREPSNAKAHWYLARTYDYLGDKATGTDEQVKLYEEGVDHARRAIALDSTCVWAHYWYSIDYGSVAQCKGIFNVLGMVPELKKECAIMERLDPCNGQVFEVAGILYAGLPSLVGGDVDRAVDYLNNAIRCDSNYTASYVDLAGILIKRKHFSDARSLLQRMLLVKDPTDAGENNMYDRPTGQKMLREIADK